MKTSIFVLTALLALGASAGTAFAQRHKMVINAETPEGQLLQQAGQESDEAKKLTLLEQFVTQYPKHESAAWVYAQLQSAYLKGNQFDKALDAGQKLLALDPDDLESAHQNLKAAEAKKDPESVMKWSGVTSQLAKKVAGSSQPKEADEVEDWKKRVDYAKQVDVYSEYSLYAMALQTTDPKKKLELIDALQQRNPQSQYLPQLAQQQFLAYRQTGDNEKAVALAEKVLATDQSNEDMLLVAADGYLQKNKNPEKVLAYSAKMIDVMNTKPKPEGVSDADWENRKKTITGLAHYMSGKVYLNQNKYAPADKDLRAALPFAETNKEMKAEVLFLLALANYKMEKIPDAIRFNQQCAAIPSRFQAQANKNLAVIRSQYRAVK